MLKIFSFRKSHIWNECLEFANIRWGKTNEYQAAIVSGPELRNDCFFSLDDLEGVDGYYWFGKSHCGCVIWFHGACILQVLWILWHLTLVLFSHAPWLPYLHLPLHLLLYCKSKYGIIMGQFQGRNSKTRLTFIHFLSI